MNTGKLAMDRRSRERLHGVHPKLKGLIEAYAKFNPSPATAFIVTEGVRSLERQRELVKAGASLTLKSKHLTGRAVDLAVVVNGEVRWDWNLYRLLADSLKDFAANYHRPLVRIVAGADWVRFKDGCHFELHPDEI